MAKLTLGQKADRMLRFLLGVRHARVAAVLRVHGFTEKDLNEGWSLLRALGKTRLDAEEAPVPQDEALVYQLDQWENKWFPIAKATLARHAPAVHAWFFRNLSQTEGPAVVLSVGTFLQRFDSLEKPEDKGGPKGGGGKAAKKKLQERGLSAEVLDAARALIDKLGGIQSSDVELPDLEQEEAELAAAESAMWAWYREWSDIARTVIKQRSLLRLMGFLQTNRAGVEEEVVDEEDEVEGEASEKVDVPEEGDVGGKGDATKPK
ncbi:MAG: hypothetical protein IPK82_26620 [Polyangiaceae bacterium]|nr:hypothetical protein [Polyangiaceae bacterium]